MECAKAVVAGLTAGLGSLAVAITDGHISLAETVALVTATLIAAAATWTVPNQTAG